MELFDFQKAWANTAVEYFKSSNLKVPRFNLFLDMGLGKTYISLDICKQLSVDSILVICPKSLVTMWEYEINNYFRCKPPKYTVINYEQFINNDTEYKPDILILDEVHRVKNCHSKTHKRITEHVQPKRIICLTGTPITKDYMDLFGISTCCSPSQSFYGLFESQFKMRYINNKSTAHTNELIDKIKPYTLFARLEDYVNTIPNYEDVVIPVKLHEVQYSELKRIYYSENSALTRIVKAQQITSSIDLPFGKRTACEELIYDLIANENEKVVIFCKFDNEYNYFMQTYSNICVGINGKTKNRDEMCYEFQHNPDIKLFVANLQAASVGLTLTAAHRCIFYSETFTWGDMDQAKARIYRIGQTNFCTYYYLIGENSIDELIHLSNVNKTDLINDFKNKYGGK